MAYSHQVIQDRPLIDCAEIDISTADRSILRDLAHTYQSFLELPVEAEKLMLQQRKNDLDWVRPTVICFPEISWREIVPAGSLICQGQLARSWETRLRQSIFIAEMGSDQCLSPVFPVGYVHEGLDWGVAMRQEGDLTHGSYRWEAPLKTEEDLSKVLSPVMVVDFTASEQLLALARQVFTGILSVVRHESWYWTNGLTQTFIHLRGLEQMMYDMMDHPAFVHALMTKLRDGTLLFLEELESRQLLFPNWGIHYCGSGGIGATRQLPGDDFSGQVRLRDQWGFSESQETVGVSPRMFDSFIFPYQLPILEKFGLNYYGCCEPVDQRWKSLPQIPNLRRVSVSPWSSREKMADFLGRQYVFALKPNPAVMAFDTFPEDEIRAYTRETLAIAGECHLEFILKDVTTVNHEPQRINRWIQIVKEEILNFSY